MRNCKFILMAVMVGFMILTSFAVASEDTTAANISVTGNNGSAVGINVRRAAVVAFARELAFEGIVTVCPAELVNGEPPELPGLVAANFKEGHVALLYYASNGRLMLGGFQVPTGSSDEDILAAAHDACADGQLADFASDVENNIRAGVYN